MGTQRGGRWSSARFDPLLIVAQIACMQCLFYAALCPFVLCARALAAGRALVADFALDALFVPARVVSAGVFPALCAHVCAAAVCAAGLVFVVGKAKRCWDYATTICVLHALASLCVARGACGVFWWWAILVATGLVCTFLGEYLCMRHELRAIPIRSHSASASASAV